MGKSHPGAKSAAGLVFAALLCFGAVNFHAARVAGASRAALAKKRAALDAEVHDWEERIAARPRERPDAAATTNPPPRPRAAPNSKIAALILASYRGALGARYESLYEFLSLSPAQIGRFEDLMTAHEEEIYDLVQAARLNGLRLSDPAIALLRQEENDEFHAAQLSLLGSAGFQQLQQSERLLPAQNFVDVVQLNTGFPPEPLTGAQATELAAILAHASGSYQNGGAANPADVDWDTVLAQAQGILSPSQSAALKVSSDQIELDQLRKRFFQSEAAPK